MGHSQREYRGVPRVFFRFEEGYQMFRDVLDRGRTKRSEKEEGREQTSK